MGENERMDDAAFAHEILKTLPTTAVPAGLQARILADFDRLAPGRRQKLIARLGERLWPGAPAWQPAVILAFSLMIGLTAGALVPSPSTSEQVVATIDVAAADTDLDRDL